MAYKLKALVVGKFRGKGETYTKKIKSYGIDVVRTDGKPGKFDTDCDIVIFFKFAMSHQKFWDVKEAYSNRGIPMFSIGTGFSEIKEDLEQWIKENKPPEREVEVKRIFVPPPRKEKTAMAQAFQQATFIEEPAAPPPRMIAGRAVHNEETVARIKEIIFDCMNAEMNVRDTINMLHAEGLRAADGSEFSYGYVHTLRGKLQAQEQVKKAEPTKEMIVEKKENSVGILRPTKYQKQSLTLSEKMDLIGKVLASNIAQDRKLILVEAIQKGEISGEESATTRRARMNGVDQIQILRTSIYSEQDQIVMAINKVQAIAISSVMDKIKEFAAE